MRRWIGAAFAWSMMAVAMGAVDVPLQNLRPIMTAGFVAQGTRSAEGVIFEFRKTGEERRLLAVEGVPKGNLSGVLAAEIQYQLALVKGEAPRLALIAWDKDGGCWYKVAGRPARTEGVSTARLSAASLSQTAFSEDASGQLEWGNVGRLWIGFVFDGPAEGRATIKSVRFTDTPVVPTEPVPIIKVDGRWSDGHDPAVKTTLTTPNEGPGGQPCFKYEFEVPAGRHMYACPATAVLADDLEGYKALRLKIKGVIPPGMRLLIQFSEQGGPAYYIEKSAAEMPAEWAEIVLPLGEFKPATWAPKDDNGRLDLGKLNTLSIGSHGTPAQATRGLIMACEVALIP